ncbi:MAG TPA: DUF6799 domain-containing protein [Hanamia sp.]|nr:DUF6799 domain-containing protein [Hanamia sp.]
MTIIRLLVFALMINFTVSAQNSDSTNHRRRQNQYGESGNQQWYQMQNGSLVMYSHGEKNAIIKDVTLPDGTTITTDGKVTWKDGKTHILQDGESIGMNGKIHTSNNGSNDGMKHMRNNSDSTK